MTIAVVGVGAIGAAFSAELWRAGRRDLVFCVRRALPRWVVEREGHETVMTPSVLLDPAEAQPVDWVLLATKAHDTEGAASWLARASGPRTCVVVLQNGVDLRERVTPYVGEASVLPAIVQCPAQRTGPGHVSVGPLVKLLLPANDDARRFAGLFAGSAADIELREDFATPLWEKLCLNAVGSLAAIVDAPLDLRSEPMAELARSMLREILAVARAEGAKLDDAVVERVVAHYARAGRPNSILLDRRAGRPLEVDARNGVIMRRARAHGIAAPANAAVTSLLREISERHGR